MPDNVDVLLIFLFQRSGTGQCFQMSLYHLFLTQIFWKRHFENTNLGSCGQKRKKTDYIREEK